MTNDEVEMEELRSGEENAEAHEPLIKQARNADDLDDAEGNAEEHAVPPRLQQHYGEAHTSLRKAGKVVWVLTLSAGISGLLFGYDTGVISSTLVSIHSDLGHNPLTTTDKSLITAVTSFFALLSSPCTGYLADRYGRRFVILLANLLFILGAVVQAAASNVPMMVAGRSAVGAAVGLASCATPLYITEVAPAQMRGRLVTIQSLFITGGQVVAYLVGWALASLPGGWRWMVGLGAVPAALQLFLLAMMLETPRWLGKAGQDEKARGVLEKVYGGLPEDERERTVEHVLASIEAEVGEEANVGDDDSAIPTKNNTARSSFRTTVRHLIFIPGNRRALTIASMLQAVQQLCGFNSLMYFSATIFMSLGFKSPIGTSLTIACTNFVFTVFAFAFIDTIGRRRILLCSIPWMVLALGWCSWAFWHIVDLPPRTGQEKVFLVHGVNSAWPGTLLAAMLVYVAAYAIGLGCVPWQQSELFPLRVRSLGSGIATATNWSSNFVIGISFLPMMELLSPMVTFAVYALVCLVGWIAIYCIYPETAGLELEGIGELLKEGWGVAHSVQGFRLRKRKTAASLHGQHHETGPIGRLRRRFRGQ